MDILPNGQHGIHINQNDVILRNNLTAYNGLGTGNKRAYNSGESGSLATYCASYMDADMENGNINGGDLLSEPTCTTNQNWNEKRELQVKS